MNDGKERRMRCCYDNLIPYVLDDTFLSWFGNAYLEVTVGTWRSKHVVKI